MRVALIATLTFLLYAPLGIQAQYKVMLSDNYPPYNYTNEKGNLVGFNLDILNAIKDLYKIEINATGGEWKEINEALKNGDINAIAGVHYPGSLDNNYIYTRSVINTAHCFMYNSEYINHLSLEKFRSLKEPLVALWNHDVLTHYIKSINPSTKFLFIKDYEELIKTLDDKNVTCIFAQRVGSMYQAKRLGKDYIRSIDHQIMDRSMGFKISKNNPDFAAILNDGMEVILANGEYQKIYDKWIPKYQNYENHWSKYLRYILVVSIIVITLFLLLLIFNQILKTRIRHKTQDLQQQLELNSQIMKELEMQKMRAEESDRMKSAFLANMSHEIRTPMNGILGFTELLKTVDYSSEEQQQFIEIIEQSGNRMLNTINNIIDVSKLESGIETSHRSSINIKNILTELRDFFTPETKKKGINFVLEQKGAVSTKSFFTDEYKLNSILTNLIKNAIKFTNEGRINVSYSINDSYAEFWITDTGIGIPKNKQASIFEQFVQANFSHSSGSEGSGLGLSITNGYVKLLNGELRLKSTPQKGTTFYIRIPNTLDESPASHSNVL